MDGEDDEFIYNVNPLGGIESSNEDEERNSSDDSSFLGRSR